MKALLLALLAGCATDLPEPAHIYSCDGTFYCLGRNYGLTPTYICADSQDVADDTFQLDAEEITAGAKCDGTERIYFVCTDSGRYCTK